MSTSLGSEGAGGGWDDGTGAAEGQFPDDEPPFKRSRKRTKQGVYTSDITLDDLAAHFHQPASKACQELGMGLTIFKRVCRKLGLQRWPYEKPCKAEGERTSGAARAGGTPRGTGSWHLPPVTQAWAGGGRAGNHAAAPGGSRASSGQASGQELVAAAAQIEGALQQQDKRVRTAAIQHLAEILVKDSDAAEELLAAIGTAVQQQQQQQQPAAPSLIQPGEGQQHQQPQQEQAGEAGRVQQLPQPSRPQALLAPPPLQARPHQQQVQLQQRGPQFPTLQPLPQPAQQQGTVEQLLAALQDVQPPVSRPLGVLLQQPALPLNMAGQHPGPAQQPPPQPAMLPPGPQQAAPPQQQDDLAAVLDVLRSAFEAQTGAGPQMESGLSDVAQQAMPQSAAMPGEPDRITPLLQQLLSWGQPHSLPKQEQPTAISQTDAPRALASVAALHASELSVQQQQQQQPQQHQGRQGALSAVPAGSIGSPPKPQSSQQTLAMGLVVAAVQGQASSQSAQPPPPAGPQKRDAGLSAVELGLLAAIQQAGGGAAAQSTARQLVQVPARLPSAGDPSSPRQAPKPPAP